MENVFIKQAAKPLVVVDNANTPLSFLEWKQQIKNIPETDLKYHYNKYIVGWFSNNKNKVVSQKFLLRQKYLFLLDQLEAFFTEEDKNIWYNKVNLYDEKELLAAIPFFAKKLKDVALYYLDVRKKLKHTKLKYNTVGTTKGVEHEIYSYILNALTPDKKEHSPEFLKLFSKFPDVQKSLNVTVEELYDDNQYFDRSPTVPITKYVDTLNEATASFFLTKGIVLSSSESLLNTFNAPISSDLNTIVNNLTGNVFEQTDVNLYGNFVQKYLAENKYQVQLDTVTNTYFTHDISISAGNNTFFYPYGIVDPTLTISGQLAPVTLSSLQFSGAGTGTTIEQSDSIFVKSGNEIKGAWYRYIDYDNVPETMVAHIPQNTTTSFIFPYAGYGLASEDSPWTGPSLKFNEEYPYIPSKIKAQVQQQYWSAQLSANSCDGIYLNNTTLASAGATPSKFYDYADKIYVRTRDQNYDTSNPHRQLSGSWLYKFTETAIPVSPNQKNVIFWPYDIVDTEQDALPEHLQNLNLNDVCNSINIQDLDSSYFTAASAFEQADKIYKLAHFKDDEKTKAIECAWLYSPAIENSNGYYSYAQQDGLSLFLSAGEVTKFIWTGPNNTPLSSVFTSVPHQIDCPFVTGTPSVSAYEWQKCTCKQTYYSPLGHSGKYFTENNGLADFVVEETVSDMSNFDIGSWRENGFSGNKITESNLFAWYNNYGDSNTWGGGDWTSQTMSLDEDNPTSVFPSVSTLRLKTGKAYYYGRATSRFATNKFPPYVVLNSFGTNNTTWLEAKPNQNKDGWVSTGNISTIKINPGDFIKIDKQQYTVSNYISSQPIQVNSTNKGSIWATYDYIAINDNPLLNSTAITWPSISNTLTGDQIPTVTLLDILSPRYSVLSSVTLSGVNFSYTVYPATTAYTSTVVTNVVTPGTTTISVVSSFVPTSRNNVFYFQVPANVYQVSVSAVGGGGGGGGGPFSRFKQAKEVNLKFNTSYSLSDYDTIDAKSYGTTNNLATFTLKISSTRTKQVSSYSYTASPNAYYIGTLTRVIVSQTNKNIIYKTVAGRANIDTTVKTISLPFPVNESVISFSVKGGSGGGTLTGYNAKINTLVGDGGSGGSGGYTSTLVNVVPGEILQINVGRGGSGGTSDKKGLINKGKDGGNSFINHADGTLATVIAQGGQGGSSGKLNIAGGAGDGGIGGTTKGKSGTSGPITGYAAKGGAPGGNSVALNAGTGGSGSSTLKENKPNGSDGSDGRIVLKYNLTTSTGKPVVTRTTVNVPFLGRVIDKPGILAWAIGLSGQPPLQTYYNQPSITFTPKTTGTYYIEVTARNAYGDIIRIYGDSSPNSQGYALSATEYTTIPDITAVPGYSYVDLNIPFNTNVAGFVLEQPLAGWSYTNNKFQVSPYEPSANVGAKPYWSVINAEKTESTNSKGVWTWGYNKQFLDGYIPYHIPKVSPIKLNYETVIQYERKGNSSIWWSQPITHKNYNGTSVWSTLLFDTNVSNLSSIFDTERFKNLVTFPTTSASDIVLTNNIDGTPIEVNYYALNSFTWTVSTLSAQTITPIISSEYFISQAPYENLSNRFYPTIASIPTLDKVYSVDDVGGYFLPQNLGASYFINKDFTVTVSNSSLSGQFVIEDSNIHIGGRGLTKQDQDSLFDWSENNLWVKESATAQKLAGYVKKTLTKELQTFVPYQPNSEYNSVGLVTPQSKVTPWGGDKQDEWRDFNNEPKSFTGVRNLSAWAESQVLKQNKKVADNWVTDIYGNQYGLFKNLADVPIADRVNTPGELWVRNNGQLVSPASVALSQIFNSFESDLQTELTSSVLNVDCFCDTLMIHTPSILLLAKLSYDYNTNTIEAIYDNFRGFFEKGNLLTDELEFEQAWFMPKTKEVIVLVTTRQIRNSNSFAPNLYRLDLNTLDFDKIFPITQEDIDNMDEVLSPLGLGESVTNGAITYNSELKKFLVTYSGLDNQPTPQPYIVNIRISNWDFPRLEKIDIYQDQTSFKSSKVPPFIRNPEDQLIRRVNVGTDFSLNVNVDYFANSCLMIGANAINVNLTDNNTLTFTGNYSNPGTYQNNFSVSNEIGTTNYSLTILAS